MRTASDRRDRTGAVRRGAAGLILWAAVLSGPGAAAAPPAAKSTPPAGTGKGKTAAATSGTDVMARVNGHPILRRDFDLAVQLQFRGRRNPVGLKELQALRDQVLEGLIDNELLYQKAVKSEAPVSDGDVEAEFQKIREGFATADAFSAILNAMGRHGGASCRDAAAPRRPGDDGFRNFQARLYPSPLPFHNDNIVPADPVD